MAMHASFPDWYRSVAVIPNEELLEKRWSAVQEVATSATSTSVIELARLYVSPETAENIVPKEFREAFKKVDVSFPTKDALRELRVLAGATLRCIMEAEGKLSNLAVLSVVSGSFGPRVLSLPDTEHLDVAKNLLLVHSKSLRETGAAEPIKWGGVAGKTIGAIFEEPNFAPNNLPNLRQPLRSLFDEFNAKYGSAVKQLLAAVTRLERTVNIREEEIQILWWLQSHYSRSVDAPWREIGPVPCSMIIPIELAELVRSVPGPYYSQAVIGRALQVCGMKSLADKADLATVVNATPKDWREKVKPKYHQEALSTLTPIRLALEKSLDTDGPTEWFPVYDKVSGVPLDEEFRLFDLAQQLYTETLLARAAAEALE